MGWIDMLGRTYDMCSDIVGKEINEDSVLLPLAHSTANAQIELTVDMDGNVVKELTEQVVKNGRNEITIIPVTEDLPPERMEISHMDCVTSCATWREIILRIRVSRRKSITRNMQKDCADGWSRSTRIRG